MMFIGSVISSWFLGWEFRGIDIHKEYRGTYIPIVVDKGWTVWYCNLKTGGGAGVWACVGHGLFLSCTNTWNIWIITRHFQKV